MSPQQSGRESLSGRFLPSRRLAALLATGILLTVAAVGAWMMGDRYSRHSKSLGTVTDRIGLNAPFITSPDAVVEQMVEMADLKPDDVAYDLGCGDGRIIITAALKTGCHGVVYDIDPERVAEARRNVKLHGVEHLVEIRQQDIFTVDLSDGQVVFMYVLPWMTRKLIPQLRQMQPGSRIISHQFNLGDEPELSPEKTVTIRVEGDTSSHYVHRWITPLKALPNVR
ncbi:MAG: SAM-dependent methyltransferase [Pirellulaceae bacterium]